MEKTVVRPVEREDSSKCFMDKNFAIEWITKVRGLLIQLYNLCE